MDAMVSKADTFIRDVIAKFPEYEIYLNLIDHSGWSEKLSLILESEESQEFGKSKRGTGYLKSIKINRNARYTGVASVLKPAISEMETKTPVVLDLLAGSGYIQDVFTKKFGDLSAKFLNSDVSLFMTEQAFADGKFCLPQSATDLFWYKDDIADLVIAAYGVHHIPKLLRRSLYQESYRVLRKGGNMLFHDFDVNDSGAHFFSEVVDKFCVSGHRHQHFTVEEVATGLEESGYSAIEVVKVEDSIEATGNIEESALTALSETIRIMFNLNLFVGDDMKLLELLSKYFPIKTNMDGGNWTATMIRNPLVVLAKK